MVIAIIEKDGALINEKGIDVEAVKRHLNETGSIKDYSDATFETEAELVLEKHCDILIPAALEGVINQKNAERVQAKLIIEAANGPITAVADETLRQKGIIIIPDLYANAGGVTVSYFEWVKNLSRIRFGRMQKREEEARHRLLVAELNRLDAYLGDQWSMSNEFKERYLRGAGELELVRSGLDDTMRNAYQRISDRWRADKKVEDLRTAAFMEAIEKIVESYKASGNY